ncbi:GAF and ANTAR domain-containing protein [Antribacter gilvus]|uniref:GAF and ANTAR domain-containing protein n=1 Tax=Antribacter gilvus TaxID=2304675 RepID=UPI000F773F0F|nr:GAF and ANTAR domain-containing protein [Antribacter gilvus]
MTDRTNMLGLLAQSLAHADKDEPFAARLCRASVEVMGADGGALTLASTSLERLTVSASNDTSAIIENLQEVLGEGPGQTAFRENRAVITAVDGKRGGPYPVFTELAGTVAGALTVFAIPMRPSGNTIGVLTLYATSGDLRYGVADAQFLADAVGTALLADPDSAVTEPPSWPRRARVHQATGMVVAQLAVSTEDAFALLRAHAFAYDRTLDDVAADVLEGRLRFSADRDQDDRISSNDNQGNEER